MTKLIHKPLMVKKAALLASAAASAVCISSPAAAQDDGFGLEEILVTAQRRAQSIQDVPLAVSAFDASQLEVRNIDSALDLVDYVPNLFGGNNTGLGTANAYYLRGLGNTESIATFDPPVGTYIDDVYISRQNANNFAFFDLDRIEVLRGPQGTLFGRNTTGGAINVLLNEPAEEFGGFAEATYGRFERVTVRGSVDLPITDEISTKFSGYFIDDAGYAYNFVTDERNNDERSYGLRGAVKWTPNEFVTWNVSATYVYSDYANVANTDVGGSGVYDEDFATGEQIDIFTTDTRGVNDGTLRDFVASGATTNLPRIMGHHISTEEGEGPLVQQMLNGQGLGNVTENLLLVSNLTLDFEEVNIELITGWLDLNQDFILPFFDGAFYSAFGFSGLFGSPGPSSFSIANEGVHKQFSQEIKATGSLFDGFVDYVAGVYFLAERNDTEFAQFSIFPLFPPNPPTNGPLQYDRFLENDTTTGAGYIQLDWNLTDQLTVTTGVRYTDETKEIEVRHFNRAESIAAPGPVPFVGSNFSTFTTNDLELAGIPTQQNVGILTPRFALQYEVDQDILVFASATRGFKSGGWNARGVSADQLVNFAPEKVWSYEIGAKTEFWNNRIRLNATAFYSDVSDFQVPSAFEDESGNIVFITRNFADLEVYGLELEGTLVVNENITLFSTLGLQEASYRNLDPAVLEQQQDCLAEIATLPTDFSFQNGSPCQQGIVTPRGEIANPVRSPEVTFTIGSSINYPIPSSDFQVVGSAFGIFTSSYDTATSGNPEGQQLDSFWRFNGSVGVEHVDGTYGLYAECTNCFGQEYVISALAGVQYFNQPGTWQIRARYRF
ncbi:MAG: TonB-dependent receptor [Pseudomonadota bacterium]